jgi:alpha-glucoside transport system substrate-binding protein
MSNKAFRLLLVLVMALSALAAPTVLAQDELPFTVGEGPFTWENLDAFEGFDMGGETVTFFGPWLTSDEGAISSVIGYFNSVVTNGEVTYAGSDSFEQQIVIDIEGGSPPNLAAFPQPGLAANVAADGGLVALGDDMENLILENYAAGSSWVDLGTYPDENGEDQFSAIFYNVNLKSLVWYVPDEFELNGYEIPETMTELIALSEQMVEDGNTPWCIGIGSGDATGWPATDWLEDIMLRTQPPEVYDAWTSNSMPFNDESVVNAMNTFGQFVFTDGWVNGGSDSVATTDFRDAPTPLFDVPAGCMMHRQASFISSFFPDNVEVGVDADFFYFPGNPELDLGNPVLGGGTLVAITSDSPATRKFLDFLATPLANEIWMAQGGFLTPHSGVNLDAYATPTLRKQGEILLGATTFRFDGSDLMPGAIGAGAFWTGMVDFVNGGDAQEIADAIEETWAGLGD